LLWKYLSQASFYLFGTWRLARFHRFIERRSQEVTVSGFLGSPFVLRAMEGNCSLPEFLGIPLAAHAFRAAPIVSLWVSIAYIATRIYILPENLEPVISI